MQDYPLCWVAKTVVSDERNEKHSRHTTGGWLVRNFLLVSGLSVAVALWVQRISAQAVSCSTTKQSVEHDDFTYIEYHGYITFIRGGVG